MEYAIELLEENKKSLERHITHTNLMHTSMSKATLEFKKVNALKRAIKLLKIKNRN